MLRSKPERGRGEKERGGSDSEREGMGGQKGGGEWRAAQSWGRARRTGAPRGAHTMGVSAPAGDGASGRIPWACQRRRAMARAGAYHGRVSAGGRWRERAMAQAAAARTVAGSQRLTWLQTDLNPSGDRTVLVNQNLVFPSRGACLWLASSRCLQISRCLRGAWKFLPSGVACKLYPFPPGKCYEISKRKN